jgi:hypothetical protein
MALTGYYLWSTIWLEWLFSAVYEERNYKGKGQLVLTWSLQIAWTNPSVGK